MADVVINEVLNFVFSHFGNVPIDNISVVIRNFYDDEKLIKSKIAVHNLCGKILDASKVPNIITHSKKNDFEKKKKLSADDILKYVSLLDGVDTKTVFVVRNLRKMLQIDPGSTDLCSF